MRWVSRFLTLKDNTMFRTIKDINDKFFPNLDISKEKWKVLYDNYEISSYGRLRLKNTDTIINPSDNGVYTIIYKYTPKYIKIEDYVENVDIKDVIVDEVDKVDEVIIDKIPVQIYEEDDKVEDVKPVKKKKAGRPKKKKK